MSTTKSTKTADAKPAAAPSTTTPAAKPAAGKKAQSEEKVAKPSKAVAEAAPAAVEAAPQPETKDSEKKETKAKKQRQQMSTVLNIDISQARCATHLKQNLTNKETDERIKDLRKKMKDAKAAGSAEEAAALKKMIDEQSQTVLRLSSLAPVAAATVADYMIKELFTHGFDQAIGADRKLLEVGHLQEGPVSELITYPLFRRVKAWMEYDPVHEEALRKERAAANKKAKEERETKKEAEKKVKGKDGASSKVVPKKAGANAAPKKDANAASEKKPETKKKVEAPPAEAEAEQDGEDDSEGGKTTFVTYVDNALKSIRKDERYKNMRVSNRIREYGSNLVIGFLERLATLARILVQGVIDARTLNDSHIRAVVELLLTNEGVAAEEIAPIIELIDNKMETFRAHQKEEKKRKEMEMSPEEKAKAEEKKHQQELERKQKSLQSASERVKETTKKIVSLQQELESAGVAAADGAEPAADGDTR